MSGPRRSRDRNRAPSYEEPRSRVKLLVASAILVVVTVAAYSNTFRCEFVFDDAHDVVANYSIRRLRPISHVLLVQTGGKTHVHSRPVVNLSFALNYAVGKLNPFSYHVTNLIIHVLGVLALFGIARRTFTLPSLAERYAGVATPLALVIAAAWALHPLQTQAVTYVTQRYESLMGMFYLLSCYCAIRCGTSSHGHWWAVASVVACLLSMGCKEVAVSIPLVILLYDRAFMAGSFAEAWRRRWGFYLALGATWIAMGLHLHFSGGRSNWAGFGLSITPAQYATSQFGVILHYLRLSFWPYPQVFDYGWRLATTPLQIVPPAIVVLGLVAATGYALVRWPMWGVLGAWFFLILAPTSSIMPISDLAVEHRMYLPLVAVIAAAVVLACRGIVWLETRYPMTPPRKRLLRAAPALAVIVALGVAAYCRNQVYESDLSVWTDTVRKSPRNPRAYCNLGYAYFTRGNNEKALELYKQSLQQDVHYANAHYVLGFVLDQQGNKKDAVVHYREAIRINPRSEDAHYNLAIILAAQGETDKAIEHYGKALQINPQHASAHRNLGNIYARQGDLDKAIVHYRNSLEIDPSCAEVRSDLEKALRVQERRASNGNPLLENSPFLPR